MKSAVAGCCRMMSIMSHAVEVAGLAEKRFFAVVVLIFVDDEFQVHEIPAGERARGLADVLLGVVAHAHGEHLHDFAREVFVGRALDVDAGVQEGEHGRVLRRRRPSGRGNCRCRGAGTVPAVREQLAIIAHLVFVGGEVAVPEQRHLFLAAAAGS